MRKRNVHVQFWLDKKEAEAFNKKVKRSGLSREAYLRHLVNGLVPQDAPPPAYYDFMRELHRIGGNLNQIAQKAHVLGVIDERRYDEEMRKFDLDEDNFENLMIEIGDSNEDVREMTIFSMLQRAVYNRMNKDMIDYDKRLDIILGQLKDEFREQAI